MNETINNLINRRSIRKFSNQQVNDADLKLILKAGTYAPSGRGSQASKIVVIQDKDLIRKLGQINAEIAGVKHDPFFNAPTLLVVFSSTEVNTTVENGSLVLGNMLNAAYSLGVDSIWIHRAKQTFETDFGKELKKKWKISDDYIGIGNCCLGYRDGVSPKAKERKPDYIVWD